MIFTNELVIYVEAQGVSVEMPLFACIPASFSSNTGHNIVKTNATL